MKCGTNLSEKFGLDVPDALFPADYFFLADPATEAVSGTDSPVRFPRLPAKRSRATQCADEILPFLPWDVRISCRLDAQEDGYDSDDRE